jgi:hypothetical protein
MPWRYTSIFDKQYKPELEESVKNKLLLFFYYRLQYTKKLLPDDNKYIEITHKDGEIIEFRAINPFNFSAFLILPEWYNFIHTIESAELNQCREKIISHSKNSLLDVGFSSITYNSLGENTGLYYNCSSKFEMENSPIVKKLYDSLDNFENSLCYYHIAPNHTGMRFKLAPNFPVRTFGFKKVSDKSLFDSSNYFWSKTNYSEYTEKYISLLLDFEILTQDMIYYIREVMKKNTKFELEFLITPNGEINDIIFKNILVEEFCNVDEQQEVGIYKTISDNYIQTFTE